MQNSYFSLYLLFKYSVLIKNVVLAYSFSYELSLDIGERLRYNCIIEGNKCYKLDTLDWGPEWMMTQLAFIMPLRKIVESF